MASRLHPRPRYSRHSRRYVLLSLFALAAAGWFLPARWSGQLISCVQVTVPFQDALSRSSGIAGGSLPQVLDTESAQSHERLIRTNEALRHTIAALATTITELQDHVSTLTKSREWTVNHAQLGPAGELIPAKVVGEDFLTWRESLLINKGTLQGVKPGASVASEHFTIAHESIDMLGDGLAILYGEALIGTVEQAGTHTARIKLISDVGAQRKVLIGRFQEDGNFVIVDRYFWLTGQGRGRMVIEDVERKRVDEGHIAEGDYVLSDPNDASLPASMVIGTIEAIHTDRNRPLLAILDVATTLPPSDLHRVYVFLPD